MRRWKARQIALLSVLLAVLILFHQYVNWSAWFEFSDIHHETFAVGCVCFAIGVSSFPYLRK